MVINDGIYTPNEKENSLKTSPWNIATSFEVDMSFSSAEIMTMLVEYEKDYATGMDMKVVSEEISAYTSGYPFMVSRICQIIHTKLAKDWTVFGVRTAVAVLVREDNQLFKDLAKNLENHRDLYDLMYSVLILRLRISFSNDIPVIEAAYRYGYIKFDQRYAISVFNRIFETRISNYFVLKNVLSKPQTASKNERFVS